MERKVLEKIVDLEQKTSLGMDLLEVAKCYCEQNFEKAAELGTLNSLLELALSNQKQVMHVIDELVA